MLTQALASNPFPKSFTFFHRRNTFASFNLCRVSEANVTRGRNCRMTLLASKEQSSGIHMEKKRNVIEHICLLKANKDLSEEEEKDMLDFLYTTQYQMRGIVAVSMGRVSNQNVEDYNYAVFMRFQTREDIAKFYENPFYLKVLKEHVTPYCHELLNVDFESEVEDDILPIFRKGEEFNFGLEFVLLITFNESAVGGPIEDALTSLRKLTAEFPSLIVQCTQAEAFEIFIGSAEYKQMWSSNFKPFIKKALGIQFSVDPVGTEIM